MGISEALVILEVLEAIESLKDQEVCNAISKEGKGDNSEVTTRVPLTNIPKVTIVKLEEEHLLVEYANLSKLVWFATVVDGAAWYPCHKEQDP